ncbi:hypothetical protein ACJ72_02749 [Emergomyces africanus]|uniref:Aminoglycoside phosphotransferase domain-containing protein n=1 Tax=Emergomyces africanus TaxID=1955775 RepID=A0A1B7P1I9_9EURO|nr:hypothetical protein ACJ72_02749 [Emergomyces africanus]
MAASEVEYSVEREIDEFFKRTSATHAACDSYVKEHLGGNVISVVVQGVCSYTVYAGSKAEFVVQFRLKSLMLEMKTVTFKGPIGKDIDGKESLYIYVMARMEGISYLDFLLKHNGHVPENSPTFSSWRKNLVTDIARFFAMSWKSPQNVDEISRERLLHQYERELQLLLHSLPGRFHPFIRESLSSLRAILSLPMVLLHKDFGVCNIMVDEASCNLVGVIDWAEAEIAPFGLNLHSHQRLISKVHVKNGWIRYDDYILLEDIFWSTFREATGGLSDETIRIIKSARVDDESGGYNMRNLDGLLINPATRFTELDDYARLID